MSEALAPVLIGSGGALLALAGLIMLRTSATSTTSATADGGAEGAAARPWGPVVRAPADSSTMRDGIAAGSTLPATGSTPPQAAPPR